ncbi:hypothetical protein [Pseudomonas oryzihabitans]|uniref:hypothetical protein n=1 Tax=Pseudomonas oryzihabitans TaxID=47885 RepID=UPI00119F3545|nr:hypothetical protein [Pseudomonas oryzihabitans]
MPPKDRHGKTAQDYRAALIAELDAVPDYHRRRKAQRSPLLFVWLLVPVDRLHPHKVCVCKFHSLHPIKVQAKYSTIKIQKFEITNQTRLTVHWHSSQTYSF